MHRKTVVYEQNGLGSTERFNKIVTSLDADFMVCSHRDLASQTVEADLLIANVDSAQADRLAEVEGNLTEAGIKAALFIVKEDALKILRLPAHMDVDFVMSGACDDEIAVRLCQLLWPGEEASSSDFVTIDDMTINFNTYQVQVAGEPVDFTYLEYALLAFLVTHPGHAYSRDALLRRVWGFEYYGGSRTVDVHVRRVRAKLGADLAARLETVRGVGYMWSM